jgi:hypothetical protein
MIGLPPKIWGFTVILCNIFLSSILTPSFASSTSFRLKEKCYRPLPVLNGFYNNSAAKSNSSCELRGMKLKQEAALQNKSVEMVYYTMSRKKEGERKVDPYRIWFFNGTFYLIGYCHQRNEVRVFALDRIKMLHQTKESFEVVEDFDFEEFMRPSFGVYQGKPVKVRIWFSPDAAGYIKEKIWHDTQEIVPQKDGSIFIFQANSAGSATDQWWCP